MLSNPLNIAILDRRFGLHCYNLVHTAATVKRNFVVLLINPSFVVIKVDTCLISVSPVVQEGEVCVIEMLSAGGWGGPVLKGNCPIHPSRRLRNKTSTGID